MEGNLLDKHLVCTAFCIIYIHPLDAAILFRNIIQIILIVHFCHDNHCLPVVKSIF